MKCDFCDKSAVVHEMTVRNGVKKEVHLCEDHARQAGLEVTAHQPINQLLTQFVMTQASAKPVQVSKKSCPSCGLTFAQFRQHSVLGCADCYDAFAELLEPLIERAQNGGAHHCGKAPGRAGESIDRQLQIRQIVKELDEAVAAEQYERAARLRDRLLSLERDVDAPKAAPSGDA